MGKRLLSIILALALAFSLMPSFSAVARAETVYNSSAAVAYAKAHWNDGVGLCAEFVSKCLAAGGVSIPDSSYYSSTTLSYENNRGALGKYTNPYTCSAALLLYLSEHYQIITDPEWSSISVGDVVFMIGGSSGDKRDGHVGIIVNVTDGIPYYAAHNKATVTGRFYDSHPCTYVVKMSQPSEDSGGSSNSGSASTCSCSVAYAGTYICTTESTNLRIRSGHGTSYATVGTIPKGATVTVTMACEEWAHVEYGGVSGYASMDYLTLQTPAVTLAAEHWISDAALGSSIPSAEQGSSAFVCCQLYDANSGSDLSDVTQGDYTATLTVYKPDGTTAKTETFSNSDEICTAVDCQTAGTYTYEIAVSGQWSGTFMGSFSVSQKTYTVTYNANGGSGAPGSQTMAYGATLTLSSTIPTRTGYTFQGWATSSAATTADYQPGGSYTANSSCTLYAVWKAKTYTVSYSSNGGSGAPLAQTKTHDTALTLSAAVPIRAGYTFLGWAKSATAIVADYQPGASFTENDNCVLYAVWRLTTYTVTYNANGGSGAPSSQTKTHGTALTLSAAVPTRAGYTFLGWAKSSTATTADYQPGTAYTKDENCTLYALWLRNKKSFGDADGDGYVDAYDASLIKKYSVGAITEEGLNCGVCDLDGDGFVDAYDAALAQKYSVGAIECFPVEQ